MFVNKEASKKELKNNILTLAQEAAKAKKENKDVINATIGMMCDEENNLYIFDSVKNASDKLNNNEVFAYKDTSGGLNYGNAIKKLLFRDRYYKYCDDTQIVATPGGTGAISLFFRNYVEDSILLPNNMWENYLTFAKENNITPYTYELFDKDNNFGIESLQEIINELKTKQDKISIILNDPCQNPTGFSMEDKDYTDLITLINDNSDTKFTILMDVAYFDFYNEDGNIIRNRYFRLLDELNDNALVLFAVSGSKSFGLYGLRIGALLLYTQDEQEKLYFNNANTFSSRAMWSSASTYGISIIENIVNNDMNYSLYLDEIKKVSNLLARRSEIFLSEAKRVNLNIYPYKKGFFLCVPTKDPVKLMNALHQDNVYVVVTKTAIRIAICAISYDEAKRLPNIIKERMEKENL